MKKDLDSWSGISVGDWRVDAEANTLHRGDASVRLEPRVMQLLCCLIEHAGQVMPRARLIDEVWGDRIVEDDALSAAVIKLRKALSDSAREPKFIETLPRLGYRLIARVEAIASAQRSVELVSDRRVSRGESTIRPPTLGGVTGPVVAVLPFQNLNPQPDQDFLVNGLSEDLTSALSGARAFPVLAASATRRFGYSGVDPQAAGAELGARYVVCGSVRRSSERVRVAIELVEVETGLLAWGEHFDRPFDDIFATQDEIATAVAATAEPAIDDIEKQRVLTREPSSLDAYELAQRGFWSLQKRTWNSNDAARTHFTESLAADSRYARAYAGMSWSKSMAATRRWEAPDVAYREAMNLAQRALEFDPRDPRALRWLGTTNILTGQLDLGVEFVKQAVELYPSYADAYTSLAYGLAFQGKFDEALLAESTMERLRPGDPTLGVCIVSRALATYQQGDYKSAEAVCERSLALYADYWMSNLLLIAARGQKSGVPADTRAAEVIQRAIPGLDRDALVEAMPFKSDAHIDHIIDGLKRAGLSV